MATSQIKQREYAARYRAKHRAKHRERARRWKLENPDKVRSYYENVQRPKMRAKYLANRQARIAASVKWAKANPTKRKVIMRRYRKNHPEKEIAKKRRDNALRRMAYHLIRAGVVPKEILQAYGLAK